MHGRQHQAGYTAKADSAHQPAERSLRRGSLQPFRQARFDPTPKAGEQAVETEVSAIRVDAVDIAAGPLHGPQVTAVKIIFAKLVDALNETLVAEIERAVAKRTPEQLDRNCTDFENIFSQLRAIGLVKNPNVAEAFLQERPVAKNLAVEKPEMLPVISRVDLFRAPKVDHPKLPVFDQKISRMRVGVEHMERVNLVIVKIPKSLTNAVAVSLRCGRRIGELIQRHPIDPIECEDAGRRKIRVVDGETNIGQMPGPAGEIDRALQLHRVVRFFEQALLDLGDVGCNLAFLEPEDLEGDGLDEVQVRLQTLRDAWVLDLHRKSPASKSRSVNLPDAGSVNSVLGERIENFGGGLTEFTAKRSHHQWIRKRRSGILRLRELFRISRREEVFVDTQHLGEFERTAFEFAEGFVNGTGISFVQTLGVHFAAEGAFAVVFEIIHTHLRASTSECGNAGKFRAGNALLVHE